MPHPTLKTTSQVLRAKIRLTCGDMQDAFDWLWSHPDLPRLFPSFLMLQHQVMRASVPLMQAACEEAQLRADSDPLAAAVARYLTPHIDEEKDHDAWTLDDLEAAGFAREEVLSRIPSPDMASLVGAQYYWLHHHHPVGLLGYIALLEGSPPSEQHIDRLRKVTDLPDEAFRTYRFHGRVDPHHIADLYKALDGLPLTREDAGLIGMSASHTGRMLAKCLRGLEPVNGTGVRA